MKSKRSEIPCQAKVKPKDYIINKIPMYKTNEIDNYDSVSNTISKSTSVITLVENIRKPLKQLSYPYFVEEDLDQEMSNRCQNPAFNKSFENFNNDSNYIEYWSPEITSKNVPVKCTRVTSYTSNESSNCLNEFQNHFNNYNDHSHHSKVRRFYHRQKVFNKFKGKQGRSNPTIAEGSCIKVLSTSNTENAYNTKSMPTQISFKKRVNLSPRRSTIMNTNYSSDDNYDEAELYNLSFLSAKSNQTQHYFSQPLDTADLKPQICKYRDTRKKNLINKTTKHSESPPGILRAMKSSPCNINHPSPTKSSSLTIAKFTLHENDKGIFVPFSWFRKIEAEEVKLKIIRKELSMIPKPTTKGNKFYKSRHSTLVCKIATPHRVMTHFNLPILESF